METPKIKKGPSDYQFCTDYKNGSSNITFQKKKSTPESDASGRRTFELDYLLSRSRDIKRVKNCKVLPEETVSTQHKPVLPNICLIGRKKAPTRGNKKIK